NYSSYGRLAVHSDGYIGHWFDGVEDFAIIGNAPSGTQFVDLFVDASPSAGTTLPSGPNLVLNPSFENGDTSWSVWGGGSIVSNNAHEGSFSLIAVAEGGAEQIITGLSPNTSYTLTAYAKSSNGTSNAVIGVKNHGGSQKTASTTNMTYQLVTVLFTTGSTSTSATIFGFNPTNNAVYFDNFNLTDGTVTKYAPIVALTAPSNGTDYSELQQVLIVASASDSDGSVSSVEFFINELSVGTDYNSPYSINWTIPAYGSYEITAKATDNDGLSTTSSVVSITATSANLVLNPSFENGDTSWSVWGGGSIVSNNAQEGSSSLIAVAEGGAEQIITGLSPNTSYTLTAYAKSSNGSSNAVVGVKNHGGSQKTASTTNMTYQLVTVLFTTGSTSTSAKIFGYNSTNNTVYFDNFHLAKSPLISARFMNEIERDELLYNFKIYPNPASSNLTLEVKNLDIEQDTYVRLYDLTGRCVLSQFLNLYEGSNQVNLSLHSMQKGTYMIRLQFQHEYIQKRLIIK
ncbi:carbohydrate binding domain-containing protein, partial [Gelidibacter japonicus]|uniref:carbohydrate binding domain-containing protein n=1 Tax=Gelidibacter japonicus TaxID=1962232 RepID=UPI00202139BF